MKLLIVRHGNTFDPGDTLLRVGITDIPLANSGIKQAISLGEYIRKNMLVPDKIYTSQLSRTINTAQIALPDMDVEKLAIFNEIDYCIDEGMPEEKVKTRIGAKAMQAWEQDAIVPDGWNISPEQVINNWQKFAAKILQSSTDKIILVVTSNGIARFAPYITNDYASFKENHKIKLSTGAIGQLSYINNTWQVDYWNHQTC